MNVTDYEDDIVNTSTKEILTDTHSDNQSANISSCVENAPPIRDIGLQGLALVRWNIENEMSSHNCPYCSGPRVPDDHPAGHVGQPAGHCQCLQDKELEEAEGLLLCGLFSFCRWDNIKSLQKKRKNHNYISSGPNILR